MICGEKISLIAPTRELVNQSYPWLNDGSLVRNSSYFRPLPYENHLEWYDRVRRDEHCLLLLISENRSTEVVGMVQLVDIHQIYRSAEMRIRIGRLDKRGQGFGQETLRLLLRYAWQDLNLERVFCSVFADNGAAIATYEKCGFVREGVLRRAAYIDGAWKDVIMMGILRNE